MNQASTLLAFLTLPGLALAADQPLRIPEWLTPYPGATRVASATSAVSADASYMAPATPAEVVRHYQDQLGKTGVKFQADSDGIGTAIRFSEDKTACVVRITEQEEGASVSASCALSAAVVFSPIIPEAPLPAAAPESKPPSVNGAASRTVVYQVEGSAKRVSVTYKNAAGATEHKVVIPPFDLSFQAPAGAPVYLSGEKIRVTERDMIDDDPKAVRVVASGVEGTVHVMIRVSDKLLQEAATSVPHGVATASGVVPE
jgi:hypothetical protein